MANMEKIYGHIQQLQKRLLTTSVSTFLSLQVHKATFSPSETWEALQELDKVMLFLISAQISSELLISSAQIFRIQFAGANCLE